MIRYIYKNSEILFIGINPHPGSHARSVPFSNNKTFWYLLSDAGFLDETRDELRDDAALKRIYEKKFNPVYGFGLINIIDRPTIDITGIRKDEELPGRKRITRILQKEAPSVVCFIGKVTYQKYKGLKNVEFGWQDDLFSSKVFVMHSPLRGEASIRVKELREIKRALKHL